MKLMSCISLIILALAISSLSNAKSIIQSRSPAPTGKLIGLILDANQARVIAAKVIVEGKGVRREVASAEDGSYEIDLPEGKYKITVKHNGFYPSKKKNVRVSSNTKTRLDILLKVGKRVDELHP